MSEVSASLKPRRTLLLLSGLLAVIAVILGLRTWHTSTARATAPPSATKLAVVVTRSEVGLAARIIDIDGKVVPARTVEVRPQVGGLLKSIFIKDGDRLQAGQLLFAIDDAPLRSALAQAQAQYKRDKALADNSLDTETRLKPLAASSFVTGKDFATAVNTRISLAATALASKTLIDRAKINLGYAEIRAPIAGRAGAVLANPGTLVSPNGTAPLLVINNLSPVDISFAVAQPALAAIREARRAGPVVIQARDSRTQNVLATGELVFMDNAFNDLAGTLTLKARFANTDEALWPGEFYSVRIILGTDAGAVTVPEVALQEGQTDRYVYVVADAKAKIVTVQIARILDGRAVVSKGLSGGELVVMSIPSSLRDGSPVEVSAVPAAPIAPLALQ